jgi:ABC-type sugar transport system ATPase subunit
MTLLQLEALGKDYGPTVALRSLSCEVRPGEVVGLLGPNGSGKTTTMKLPHGDAPAVPRLGAFGDLDCTRDARRVKERIGYTPEEPAFYDFLTGRETISFVLNVRGVPLESAWARLGPLVELVDFAAQLDVATGGYSHGTKKKRRSSWPWPISLRCSFSTSPPTASIRRRRCACAPRCATSRAPAVRSSSRRTSWRWPSSSAIACLSFTKAQ